MIEQFGFTIPGFESRNIRIFKSSTTHSPLLLFFDGQNVFDDHGSFAGGWFAHQAIQGLAVKPTIVGINNGGLNRIHELCPFPYAGKHHSTLGLGGKFIDGIISSLLPELHHRYGVSLDSRHVTIAGSSLGGMASIYAHLKHPNVFGKAIAMSPSLFISDENIQDMLSEVDSLPRGLKLYLDAGEKEASGYVSRRTKWFHNSLVFRGYDRSNIVFVNDADGTHNEKSWAKRLPSALKFLE